MELYPKGYPGSPLIKLMWPEDTIHIPPRSIHRFTGLEDSRILEVSTQHFEDDSYRLLKGD